MNIKKMFFVFTVCLFACSVLIAAGFRFGMPSAVKAKVNELDIKVAEKNAARDTTRPTVSSTNPLANDTNIAINRKIIAIFSEAMAPETITPTTFMLKQGVTAVSGAVSYSGRTAVFTPTSNLTSSATHTATITAGVKDLAGNSLAINKVWTFVTGASSDTLAPTVLNTVPANAVTGIVLNTGVNATFSEAIDPATITTAFTLKETVSGTLVPGTATSVGSIAAFDTTENLKANTEYTATITAAVEDLAGNLLATATTWSFRTGTTTAAGPAPVDLGTASNFVILAKSGISTTGETRIKGDIGVSPIDRTALTGFSEGMDSSNVFSTSIYVSAPGAFVPGSGKLYAADYAAPTPANMTTAISDIEIAFTDAAGRTNPTATELGAGNISGMTLPPGLYKWGTGLLITASGVTLSGGADDVWIFQIAETLTVGNGAIINLIGGAQARNIFWQVSGQTTLGTTSNFKGTILGQTLIQMQTGATLTGRMLSQTAVTLDANPVMLP